MTITLADIGRERPPNTYVPYVGHIAEDMVLLDDGSLLAILRLDGIAFETADISELNGRLAQRNILLRNIANDRVVVATHIVRMLDDGADYPAEPCKSEFAKELDAAYKKLLLSNRLYTNVLYFSVLLRPSSLARAAFKTEKMKAKLLNSFRPEIQKRTPRQKSSLSDKADMRDLIDTLLVELGPYNPKVRGLRVDGQKVFSETAEALRLILTGTRLSVPLTTGPLGGAVYTDRVVVGRETLEVREPGRSVFAAGFGLKEYPASTWPGMFDSVLRAPYRCVLTQTFAFLAKQDAQDIMSRKQNQMITSQDKAASQIEALSEAADQLASNVFVMGNHHLTLVVFANSVENLDRVATRARADLADSGAVVTREDLALEAVYWAQLPGNLALRTRPGAISSRNFAAMSSLHNYPLGAPTGHWGGPLTVFRSSGGTPYRFHLHAPTETVKDLGNMFMAGPTGSGKTTVLMFLLAMVERQGAQTVFFDKDRGGEILARAVGGSYLVLPSGAPSGLAPLKALTNSPADVQFLKELVKALVHMPGEPMTPDEERRLEQGIKAIMQLPVSHRSFRELRAFMGQNMTGPGARLERWCQDGALGWVLDNDEDKVSLSAHFLGFDVTNVLDDENSRGPILSYLFHRVESLLDGRRIVIAIDEFWKALLDEGFRDLVNDKLKTIRKLNGVVILATQSPADALRSPIAHSIIEQCPTQILLPNVRAGEEDYKRGLKLTAAEFRAIREDLTVGGRRFLLKQGNTSVTCELDLSGLDDLIAVLSGRAGTVRLVERLIAELGDVPARWLPVFKQQWRNYAA